MRQLFDFVCSDCGERTEKLVDTNIRVLECVCGGKATRTMCMPRVALDGTDPAFPSAWDKWANIREQNHKVARSRSYYKG